MRGAPAYRGAVRDNRFKAKMPTEQGRQIYARRSRIAEFAHAWMR